VREGVARWPWMAGGMGTDGRLVPPLLPLLQAVPRARSISPGRTAAPSCWRAAGRSVLSSRDLPCRGCGTQLGWWRRFPVRSGASTSRGSIGPFANRESRRVALGGAWARIAAAGRRHGHLASRVPRALQRCSRRNRDACSRSMQEPGCPVRRAAGVSHVRQRSRRPRRLPHGSGFHLAFVTPHKRVERVGSRHGSDDGGTTRHTASSRLRPVPELLMGLGGELELLSKPGRAPRLGQSAPLGTADARPRWLRVRARRLLAGISRGPFSGVVLRDERARC
jgi:hypothetical protein